MHRISKYHFLVAINTLIRYTCDESSFVIQSKRCSRIDSILIKALNSFHSNESHRSHKKIENKCGSRTEIHCTCPQIHNCAAPINFLDIDQYFSGRTCSASSNEKLLEFISNNHHHHHHDQVISAQINAAPEFERQSINFRKGGGFVFNIHVDLGK